MDLRDGALDLLLGTRCVGCDRAGRMWCAACAAGVGPPRRADPDPTPPGLAPVWAAGAYAGGLRSLVLTCKERGARRLAVPWGALLAGAALGALDAHGGLGASGRDRTAGTVVLVPVPSRPGTTRGRGHEPVRAAATRAARLLDGAGRPALVAPLLRVRPGLLDQAGLDAAERAANLAHAHHCPADRVRQLARRTAGGPVTVLLCDDVVTSGATAREAQRALESVGLAVRAVCAVAATARRHPAGPRTPPEEVP